MRRERQKGTGSIERMPAGRRRTATERAVCSDQLLQSAWCPAPSRALVSDRVTGQSRRREVCLQALIWNPTCTRSFGRDPDSCTRLEGGGWRVEGFRRFYPRLIAMLRSKEPILFWQLSFKFNVQIIIEMIFIICSKCTAKQKMYLNMNKARYFMNMRAAVEA